MYFVDAEFIHPLIKNLPVILSFFTMFLTNIFLNNVDLIKKYRKTIYYKIAYIFIIKFQCFLIKQVLLILFIIYDF